MVVSTKKIYDLNIEMVTIAVTFWFQTFSIIYVQVNEQKQKV